MKRSYLDFLAEFGVSGAHPGGFSLTKELLSAVNLSKGASILEIGCGTGQTAEYIASSFDCTVTAIDNHPVMVEKAMTRLKKQNVEVEYGEAGKLFFSDQAFDFVLAESVISFTPSIDQTLREIVRVLKKDGAMAAVEMITKKPLDKKQEKEVKDLYEVSAVLTEEEWKKKFKRAGFPSVTILKIPDPSTGENLTELQLSENIREELYDIWDAHQAFMERPDNPLSFRAFYCKK